MKLEILRAVRPLWVVLTVLFSLLVLGISPIGTFVLHVPVWVSVLLIAALVACVILRTLTSKKPKKTGIITGACAALVISLSVILCVVNPYFGSNMFIGGAPTREGAEAVTLEQAEEDMEQMMALLCRIHPAFIDEVPKEVQAAYERELSELRAADKLTVDDVRRSTQAVVSVLGDAHTNVGSSYPDLHYIKHTAKNKAEGLTLAAVNGETLTQMLHSRRELFSYEVESWGLSLLRDQLSSIEGLRYLGYDVANGIVFTYSTPEGGSVEQTYSPDDFVTYEDYCVINAEYMGEDAGKALPNAEYSIDKENDLALFTLRACVYDSEYKAVVREFFTEVKKTGVGNVVVDVRGNGGGNSMVANEFFRYCGIDSFVDSGYKHRLGFIMLDYPSQAVELDRVEELTFDGDLYLLSDATSFSSAMLFALYIKDNHLGTVVGEAPGNDPNGYGDITSFRLDNSGLYLYLSTKHFIRPDSSCTDQLVEPDVPCDGDKALETVISLING